MGLFSLNKEKRAAERRNKELVRRNPQLMSGQDTYTFRRSRTLTGSVSSSVKSANEPAAQLKSPRLKAHELRRHRRRVAMAFTVCLLLAVGAYWLLLQFVANITTTAPQSQLVSRPNFTAYAESIQVYLRAHPLERFQFALDSAQLLHELQKDHPEVARVITIQSRGIGAAQFTLELRKPVIGWKVERDYYFVDANGVSFKENYFKIPSVTVRDNSGIKPNDTNGGAIASNRFLSFLGRVVTLSSSMGVGRVESIIIPSGVGTRTVEIRLKGKAYPVRTHIDRDPAEQVQDTKRAIRFLQARGITPKYIDVRVKGKAFYRE